MRTARRILLLALLPPLAACRTATTPGSAYVQSGGNYWALLAEPTFDLGWGTESIFYNPNLPHTNADGHGYFDFPIVVGEQLLFSPVWLFSAALRFSGSEPYLNAPIPTGWISDPLGSAGTLAYKGLGWAITAPGAVFYIASFTTTMAADTVFHDVPVIVIGAPLRIARSIW